MKPKTLSGNRTLVNQLMFLGDEALEDRYRVTVRGKELAIRTFKTLTKLDDAMEFITVDFHHRKVFQRTSSRIEQNNVFSGREAIRLAPLKDSVSLNLFYGPLRGRGPSPEDVGPGRASARKVAWAFGHIGSAQVVSIIRQAEG